MPDKNYKKFLPSFIFLVFELLSHWKRDFSQNNKVKKFDKTAEQLGTIENLLIRLEKKIQHNRNMLDKLIFTVNISLLVIFVTLTFIFLKVFGII
jgi:hypothetical protein